LGTNVLKKITKLFSSKSFGKNFKNFPQWGKFSKKLPKLGCQQSFSNKKKWTSLGEFALLFLIFFGKKKEVVFFRLRQKRRKIRISKNIFFLFPHKA